MNEINLPTSENEDIENLMPISRALKRCEQKPLTETEHEIENMDDRE